MPYKPQIVEILYTTQHIRIATVCHKLNISLKLINKAALLGNTEL